MVHSEIKEVTYMAVGLFLVALVLGVVGFLIHIRDDMATTRNTQIQATKVATLYREFNKYNNETVYGEDIIEAIRTYYNTDVHLFVENTGGVGGLDYYVTRELSKANPELVDIKELQNTFKPNQRYQAYLVFDSLDVRVATVPMYDSKITHEVTGIKFISLD